MLNERSKQIRRDTIALSKANGGYHYGGCFSAVEILIALYDHVLTDDDRFILSKGHACWPWYVLLREKGFNPKLTGHPTRDEYNGVLCSTGSLGHGLPTGIGIALAKKIKGEKGRVFVLIGDGECQEGTTWESLLIAGHHKLDNLIVIVDWNGIQGSDFVHNILNMQRMNSPGILWVTAEEAGWITARRDGHDIIGLVDSLGEPARRAFLLIADTIKGKGVSFMENNPKWHACWPNAEEEAQALKELR